MPLTIPLFPLNTVLFPGGPLPLRIFEPRYLDMVSECMRHDTGIGVALIEDGSEVGSAARTYQTGTMGHIGYWNKRSDGLLGVTIVGDQRFRIIEQFVEPSQLVMAEIELIPNETEQPLPEEFEPLAELLERIILQLSPPYTTMKKHMQDASWVSARLTELLPMELVKKQSLLELLDPIERLSTIFDSLHEIELA